MLFRISIKEVDVFSLLRVVVVAEVAAEVVAEVVVAFKCVGKVMNQEFNMQM